MPRLQLLYEWSARELDTPGLFDCVQDGSLIYAWSYEDRSVWHPTGSIPVQTAPSRAAARGPGQPRPEPLPSMALLSSGRRQLTASISGVRTTPGKGMDDVTGDYSGQPWR